MAREGLEFGVLSRELAVGGQLLTLGACAAPTRTCSCRCSAPTRQATRPARWPRSRPSPAARTRTSGPAGLDADLVREAFAKVASPGRLESSGAAPRAGRRRAQPGRDGGHLAAVDESFGFSQIIGVLAVSGDKDVAGILDELEPVAARSW